MTEQLYYRDPYLKVFEAAVLERLSVEGRPAVVLDRTAFYPAGGGQPCDLGTLGGIDVLDVATRDGDGAVLHVLKGGLEGGRVTGSVDWARRFDHMQHHTGQHILSAAFWRLARAATVGFHLGEESVTIDLDTPRVAPEGLAAAEDLANEVVTGDAPVEAWFPSGEELSGIELRKEPAVSGRIRVVRIGGFDASACGGTHVARTGEVGLVKVLRIEKRGEETRVEFRCGSRALRDYRWKNSMILKLIADLNVKGEEIDQAVGRLRAEIKTLRSEIGKLRAARLGQELKALHEEAPSREGARFVVRAFEDREKEEVGRMAVELAARPSTVAILGLAGSDAQLVLARSKDLSIDLVPVLKRALAVLGSERGGGRPGYASGGGVSAGRPQVEAALAEAERAAAEALRASP